MMSYGIRFALRTPFNSSLAGAFIQFVPSTLAQGKASQLDVRHVYGIVD
jgi:hypothetical protein